MDELMNNEIEEQFDFDSIVDRSETNSIKWEYYGEKIENPQREILSLWVADMDFTCSPAIIKALHERVDKGIFGYNEYAVDEYYQTVKEWFWKRFQWEIDRDSIFFAPGVVPAISVLIRILSEQGQGVLIQRPVYYPFTNKILENERTIVNNPLRNDNGYYTMDFVDLEERIKQPDTAFLILCSPHNPVGRVWKDWELQKVVEICKRYDKFIISDEIHCDLVRKDIRHVPLEKLCPEYRDKIITCTAPSKTFNLAGLQLSNIIINNREIREKWSKEAGERCGIHQPNAFALAAFYAAYRESGPWLKSLLKYLDENIRFAKEYVKQFLPEAVLSPCEGTYLLWLDLRAYCQDPGKLEWLMRNEANLLLDEGYIFGSEGAGFERINAACPRSILKECLERISDCLEKRCR